MRTLFLVPALASVVAAEAPLAPAPVQGDIFLMDRSRWVEAVSRRRQALSAAPQAVTVIPYGQEYALPPWTVPDRLRYEAGVDVYQARHGQYDVGVRGFNGLGNTRTLVVVDGREITLEELGQVTWASHLHTSDISRIEVVKGPSSVSYGANAFGGVIALSPRQVGDLHEIHSQVDAGANGLLDVDATALGPIALSRGRLTYKISAGIAQRDDLDGPRGLRPDGSAEAANRALHTGEDDLRAKRYSGEMAWEPMDGWRLAVEYHGVDVDEWDTIEDLTIGSNRITMNDDTYGLRLQVPFGEIRWLHKDGLRDYSSQKSTYDPAVHTTGNYNFTRIGLDDSSDTVRLQIDESFGEHALSGGVERTMWESQSNFWDHEASYEDRSSWATVTVDNTAYFVEDQWQPNQAWVFSLGLRLDDHSVFGTNLSPRLAANYRFDPDHFIRASFSSGYRLANPFEIFIDEYYFSVADDLEAETVDTLDLGWSRDLPGSGLRVSLGSWYSRVSNPNAFLPLDESTMAANYLGWLGGPGPGSNFEIPPGPFFAYSNIHDNSISVYGLEGEVRGRWLGNRLESWVNATWQHLRWDDPLRYQSDGFFDPVFNTTRFRFDYDLGDDWNAPPEWKFTLGSQYQTQQGFFVAGALRYVDSQKFFSFGSTDFNRGTRLALSERPAYVAADCSLGWHFAHEDGRNRFVRVSVLDIFDGSHAETYLPSGEVLTAANEWQRGSEIGRSFALVVGWEW